MTKDTEVLMTAIYKLTVQVKGASTPLLVDSQPEITHLLYCATDDIILANIWSLINSMGSAERNANSITHPKYGQIEIEIHAITFRLADIHPDPEDQFADPNQLDVLNVLTEGSLTAEEKTVLNSAVIDMGKAGLRYYLESGIPFDELIEYLLIRREISDFVISAPIKPVVVISKKFQLVSWGTYRPNLQLTDDAFHTLNGLLLKLKRLINSTQVFTYHLSTMLNRKSIAVGDGVAVVKRLMDLDSATNFISMAKKLSSSLVLMDIYSQGEDTATSQIVNTLFDVGELDITKAQICLLSPYLM